MASLPREYVMIVALAHGYRIDIVASPSDDVPQRRLDPVHYPTVALARQFASMFSRATGLPIIESKDA